MQAKNGKPPVTVLQWRDEHFCTSSLFLNTSRKADKAKSSIGSEKLKGIKNQMGSSKNKVSTAETGENLNKFWKSLCKKPKQVKAELTMGIEKTAHMASSIFLQLLTGENNMASLVEADIKAQKVKVSETKFKSLPCWEKTIPEGWWIEE